MADNKEEISGLAVKRDVKRRSLYDEDSLDGDQAYDLQGRESVGSAKDTDRVKLVRDRQNEERQRKLEELRQQALAAQRFREQREEERRKRIDELRSRDNDRRNQVEERKRLIWEAERERREAILRKNQEREARIEAKKKNERSHIVFAFGSSTPRMLEPADTGGSTYWGTRRATSTTNVMMFTAAQPLTRRSSERELDGSKKRATSAGGLDRNPGEGEDSDGTPGTPGSSYLRVNRRRTDLMPTIPSPRDGLPSTGRSSSAKAFTRSPGRTYSMSRLDQLSQPRKRQANEQLSTLAEQQTTQNLGASSSMSRSMSHLAAAAAATSSSSSSTNSAGNKLLKRSDNSRSMGNLPGPIPNPRPTRAERLRRRARDQHQIQQPGIRSGEVTPSSPSRPQSSLSQQSGSSIGSSNVNLRPRTTTPRRPRPASIAGTGVTVTERHNFIGDIKVTKDSKPPLPKVHSSTPKKPTTQKIVADSGKKQIVDKLIKSSSTKASPRITPRATPLQSPGSEHPPIIQTSNVSDVVKLESNEFKEFNNAISEKNEEKIDQGNEKIQGQPESTALESMTISDFVTSENIIDSEVSQDLEIQSEFILRPEVSGDDENKELLDINHPKNIQNHPNLVPQQICEPVTTTPTKSDKKETEKKGAEKKSPESELRIDGEGEEPVDMSASMIAKIRITTEEEAKAALAERRRLAREQAEREAELERQRIEEEHRLELERQRAEEEEQRRLEEESLRLASEAREAEEQRLRLAIEEAQRREEEDRKRREEEAKQKLEKEEAEKKAREEAEKQRIEMAERLKKEEEERIARRKRVEAIMLRTRGKNQPNTPTKGEGGDGDKLKEDISPVDDNGKAISNEKSGDVVMTASLISEATQQFITGEQQALHIEHNNSASAATTTMANSTPDLVIRNGTNSTHNSHGVNGGSNNSMIIIADNVIQDINNGENNKDEEINGHNSNHTTNIHGNGVNSLINEPMLKLDNATVKQNNVTNNLLDLSSDELFDNIKDNSSSGGGEGGGGGGGTTTTTILELNSSLTTIPKLLNEDSINSNLNPTAIEFNPFSLTSTSTTSTSNVNDTTTNTTATTTTITKDHHFMKDNFANSKNTQQDNNQVSDLLS